MANYIPRLLFEKTLQVVFDTPPEGDPQNEVIGTEREQVRSVGGQLFTSDFYDYTTFTLRFILQSNAVALRLKQLFKDYGLKGQSFNYFPHSDDDNINYTVELESESVQFKREYPDGQGGFLWGVEFTLMSVEKTAPRIIRSNAPVPPAPEGPEAPRNLRIINITPTSARAIWDAPSSFGDAGLKNYEWRLVSGSGGTFTGPFSSEDGTTTETFLDLSNLPPSTSFRFYLLTVNLDSLTSNEVSVDFMTSAFVNPISAVRNLSAVSNDEDEIDLSWDAPEFNGGHDLSNYHVERIITGTNPRQTLAATVLNYKYTGLTPNTEYDFRVRAVNSNGDEGPWTEVDATTIEALSAVQDLSIDMVTTTSLRLNWTAPAQLGGSSVTRYDVERIISGGTNVQSTTTNLNFSFSSLSAGTTYSFRVRAVTEDGDIGPWASISGETLQALSAVRLITAVATRTSIRLDWVPPAFTGMPLAQGQLLAENIKNYDVQQTSPTQESIVVSTDQTHTFTGLSENRSHTFRIRARNNDDAVGPWASIDVSTLSLAIPSAPTLNSVFYASPRPEGPIIVNRGITDRDLYARVLTSSIESNVTSLKFYVSISHLNPVNDATIEQIENITVTRTIAQGATRGLYTHFELLDIPDNLFRARIYFVDVSAVNATGEGVRSVPKSLRLPRNVVKDVWNNNRSSRGHYIFTDDLGDRIVGADEFDEDFGLHLANESKWDYDSSYPDYRFPESSINEQIKAMSLPLVNTNQMCIAAYVNIGGSSSVDTRLLLLEETGLLSIAGSREYAVKRYQVSSGAIEGMTPVKYTKADNTSWDSFYYVKWLNSAVFYTQEGFPSSEAVLFTMSHKGNNPYFNSGMTGIGNYIYVSDFGDSKLYAYELSTTNRASSADIQLSDYTYPISMWADGTYIYVLGSSTLTQGQNNSNKVYCYSIDGTRQTDREFTIDSDSYSVRNSGNVWYQGLVARDNRFVTCKSESGSANHDPFEARFETFKF